MYDIPEKLEEDEENIVDNDNLHDINDADDYDDSFPLLNGIMILIILFSFFDWIKITNATNSTKVGFSYSVIFSPKLHFAKLGPGVCRWTEEKHLQGKARHHIISQRVLHNTSSLASFPLRPPVTTSCWLK